MEKNFREFLRLCAKYNPEVTADDICDLVTCSRCPFDHMSDEDYTVCQAELDVALEDVKRDYHIDEEQEKAHAESRLIIQPVEGINKPYYYIKQDTEGHTTECFGADKEGIEALKQVVHGREIEWVPGWNVHAERELNAAEFRHLVSMYAGFVR